MPLCVYSAVTVNCKDAGKCALGGAQKENKMCFGEHRNLCSKFLTSGFLKVPPQLMLTPSEYSLMAASFDNLLETLIT